MGTRMVWDLYMTLAFDLTKNQQPHSVHLIIHQFCTNFEQAEVVAEKANQYLTLVHQLKT